MPVNRQTVKTFHLHIKSTLNYYYSEQCEINIMDKTVDIHNRRGLELELSMGALDETYVTKFESFTVRTLLFLTGINEANYENLFVYRNQIFN